MKRRNAECGKLRRPLKRNKITEGFYGSTLLYLKFLVLWALVLLADFILEFRFEFLWPFWLLLRSVYDSFKYQGLAFSVFFICIALTSDMICFFFIPVQWLFFAASTYVWVQYVWHTEKGVCLPTIILWLLFVYIEAAVRLRDLRHLPFHLDLCRPFAAHCIGYPVVTLGFGFKSYVGYRMRQRKQKDVSKENEFYMQLLQQALPLEQQQTQQPLPQQQQQQSCQNTSPEKSRGVSSVEVGISNGVVHNTAPVPQTSTTKNNHRKSLDKGERDKCVEAEVKSSSEKPVKYSHTNGTIHTELEFIERVGSVNDFDENEVEKDKSVKGSVQPLKSNSSSKWSNNQAREIAVNTQRERKNKANRENAESTIHHKDEYCLRLEADVKRLKTDLQSSRQLEQDLHSQINTLISSEKSIKSELAQLQQDNDDLQSKLHGLVIARQMDKQTISQLERRLQDERRLRSSCEAQLAAERKAKKSEEAAATRAIAMAAAVNKNECTESCRARRRDLETEGKQLRRELKLKDDRYLAAEREMQSLRQYKESHNETEILMSALSAMQDKNAHLENSLSAETRIKLDLFSALGEAKRQLEIRESLIRTQEKEIEELKSKIAQVLAVMPTDTFCPGPTNSSGMSKLRLPEIPSPCPGCTVSNLDPNATVYTPKGSLVASTEA
ncbi:macoilin-1 isoform X2 [Zootermopsis nevadensis]|uniref:macoilin-1 isoform X2 n=1 Tax=Zootermopsis nevadensis TaxID=136037 RepID=UPI000B8E9641|nr:macoilin-1 isoform X2 [Zootermopsis nevadensis]